MTRSTSSLSLTLLFLASLLLPASAQFTQTQPRATGDSTCSTDSKCPSTAPCCSEFGHCGTGTFCLGGCNPFSSFSPDSCAPMPVCKSGNFTFDDGSRIANATEYNNDPDAKDWTLDQGQVLFTQAGELILPMTDYNGDDLTKKGTRISSTRQVHYGTITARLKTTKWGGVITAFITMSDSKDELDWEFPGTDTRTGQTNWFGLGDTDNFTHGGNGTIATDSSANYHDYTFDWQPDAIRWLIDGKVVRTLTKASTLDRTTGRYKFPSMPSRVQLSIWGVNNASAPGTVDWAGGQINWNSPDYTSQGYYYALVDNISIDCYDDPNMPAGTISYRYTDNDTKTGQPQIKYTTDATTIFSQKASGIDMEKGGSSGGNKTTNGLINGRGVRGVEAAVGRALVAGTALAVVGLFLA